MKTLIRWFRRLLNRTRRYYRYPRKYWHNYKDYEQAEKDVREHFKDRNNSMPKGPESIGGYLKNQDSIHSYNLSERTNSWGYRGPIK